jgi:hypothetical protein
MLDRWRGASELPAGLKLLSSAGPSWIVRPRCLFVLNGACDASQGNAVRAMGVSRRGHEVLDRDLRWLRTVERLNVELTPELEHKARPSSSSSPP